MTEHAGVVQITTFPTDQTGRAQLIDVLQRISDELRNVEGCFGSQVCSVDDRPEAVATVSRWRSRSDLDGYLSQHGHDNTHATEGLLSGVPETVHLTSLSPDR